MKPSTHPLLILLAALLLSACSLPLPAASPSPSPTSEPSLTASVTNPPTPTETLALPSPSASATPSAVAKRVIILSLDGLRAPAVAEAPMTFLLSLEASSAYSLKAQTIFPSATLPSHASMLTGLCPSKTGIDWNDYQPEKGHANGPSLFDVAHAAGLQTVMVAGKHKLVQVTDEASLTSFTYINDRDVVIMQNVLENFPADFGVLFIHFPTPDAMGHTYGWESWQYLDVLRQADGAIASLFQALDQKNLRSQTLVIITADHGGHALTHGTSDPRDMTIPWFAVGPGVAPGELAVPINTTDTAATAAWALGLPLPANWDGIPVYEAFGLTSPARLDPRCP